MSRVIGVLANLAARLVDNSSIAKLRTRLDGLCAENRRLKEEAESLKDQLEALSQTRNESLRAKHQLAWTQAVLARSVVGQSTSGGLLAESQVMVLALQAERHRQFLASLRGVMAPVVPILEQAVEQMSRDSVERVEMETLLDVYRRTDPGVVQLQNI